MRVLCTIPRMSKAMLTVVNFITHSFERQEAGLRIFLMFPAVSYSFILIRFSYFLIVLSSFIFILFFFFYFLFPKLAYPLFRFISPQPALQADDDNRISSGRAPEPGCFRGHDLSQQASSSILLHTCKTGCHDHSKVPSQC